MTTTTTKTKTTKTFDVPEKVLVSYDRDTANAHLAELLKEEDVEKSIASKHKFAVIGFDTETRPTFMNTRAEKKKKKNKVALVQFASRRVACLVHLASMEEENGDAKVPEMMTKILKGRVRSDRIGIKTDLKELKEDHYDEKDKDPGDKSVDLEAFVDLAIISEVFKHERPGMKAWPITTDERGKAESDTDFELGELAVERRQVKYAAEDASLGVWLAEQLY